MINFTSKAVKKEGKIVIGISPETVGRIKSKIRTKKAIVVVLFRRYKDHKKLVGYKVLKYHVRKMLRLKKIEISGKIRDDRDEYHVSVYIFEDTDLALFEMISYFNKKKSIKMYIDFDPQLIEHRGKLISIYFDTI